MQKSKDKKDVKELKTPDADILVCLVNSEVPQSINFISDQSPFLHLIQGLFFKQYNTAFSTLKLLCQKGGVTVGIATFGNMSTFAPTWSYGNEALILRYKDRPNQEIYAKVREFAKQVLRAVHGSGTISPVSKEFYYGDIFKGSVMMKVTKLLISSHTINANKCIGCGTCASCHDR